MHNVQLAIPRLPPPLTLLGFGLGAAAFSCIAAAGFASSWRKTQAKQQRPTARSTAKAEGDDKEQTEEEKGQKKRKVVGLEYYDASQVNADQIAADRNWWRDLPFVCVLLMSKDEEWFTLNMSEDQGVPELSVIGFESVDDAKKMCWTLSNDPTSAIKQPTVQVISTDELLEAIGILDSEIYVLHKNQIVLSNGDTLSDVAQLIYDCYFRERKLAIPFTNQSYSV
mmetsp:Transcript_12936/g.32593  ORF Transcript_12936/g.32593 Transcript_12936/m.32593 type:complete len:225 (-) Transcript_12936:36-710(-)